MFFVKCHKILQKVIQKLNVMRTKYEQCVPEVTLRIYIQAISRKSYLSSVLNLDGSSDPSG